MPIIDDINQAFRDFTAWNAQNPLPVGDPRSGVHNPSKSDIRSVLLAVLQALGNPDALNSLVLQINGKADRQNSGKVFTSRAAALSVGQTELPGALGLIFTVEGASNETLAIRSFSNASDDPLFETQPRWGVAMRVPNTLALDAKADSAVVNPRLTPSYTSRAAAVTGAADLPTSVSQILVREGTALVVRSRAATADDPFFTTAPQWGVVQRQDMGAALREMRDGRVWHCTITTDAGPSGQTPPPATNRIVTNYGNNSVQWWRSVPAPGDGLETPTMKRTADGAWWIRIFDTRTITDALATLTAIRPVQVSVVASSTAGERNASLWTAATTFRTITNAEIIGAGSRPADVASPSTATAETIEVPGGVKLIWRDQSGRVYERRYINAAWRDWIEVPSNASRAADNAARASGDDTLAQRLDALPPVQQTVRRGAAPVAVEMNDRPVLAFNDAGQARMVVDQWTLDNLAGRLQIDGGGGNGGSASPALPDILGNTDGWNAWLENGLVTFTAALEGPSPREYVMKPGESPWVNGRSVVPVRLLYGDQMGAAGVSVQQPVNTYRIATLNDGAGQAGLAGAEPTAPASGIQRAGPGFAAIVADLWVTAQSVARWALVRAENVAGASLASLTSGRPMANLVRALTEAERLLPGYRRQALPEAVTIMHGAGDDSPSFANELVDLMQEINSRVGQRRINLYQPSGTTQRANFSSAEGTLEAFRQKGTLPVTLVSPTYWCAIAAGTVGTLAPVSMTMLAELEARAAADDNWIVPLAFNASRSGAVIDIDFEVMPAVSLVAPTEGLHVDGASIQSVAIVADPLTGRMTRLRITLTTAPSGPVTVRYCRGPSARFTGNLRDNWSAPSITGGTLYRHACSFQFTV